MVAVDNVRTKGNLLPGRSVQSKTFPANIIVFNKGLIKECAFPALYYYYFSDDKNIGD